MVHWVPVKRKRKKDNILSSLVNDKCLAKSSDWFGFKTAIVGRDQLQFLASCNAIMLVTLMGSL